MAASSASAGQHPRRQPPGQPPGPSPSRGPVTPALSASDLARIDARLADTDRLLERGDPGDDGSRQPVHTVYVPADPFGPDFTSDWGAQALAATDAHGGLERLGTLLGQLGVLAEQDAELFQPAPGLDRGQGLGAPVRGEVRAETVGRYVDGVHGLAGAVVARVATLQQPVGVREPRIDPGKVRRRESRRQRTAAW